MKLTIPGYHLGELIHEGPKSLVYRATRESDRRAVVIKAQREEFPSQLELSTFKLGYEIGRRLASPRVIEHIALERSGNGYALVTEDYGASSLDILRVVDYPLDLLLEISIAIAAAIESVHEQNVIHKDIKPQNIVLHPDSGVVKLIDFGISSQLSRENPSLASAERLEGTLAYISPEQTGRMNRCVDSRSDLYSFGVTLYQIFTGHLPFESADPMELIHFHLARAPMPANERDSTVPVPLARLIARLMAKTAEERYQSATGVRLDLEHALADLREHGRIRPFELGRRDRSTKLQLPQKLYGRAHEIEELMNAFARVGYGGCELLLVAGYSGIGKSALIREIHKPVVARRGWYCAGKFDQYRRDIPYQALIDALRDLFRQLLSERDETIEHYRESLVEALGDSGRLIADVVPELEALLGPQPEVDEVTADEARHRFNRAFVRFLGVFARREHPLCIFLDDLQWADLPSLQLLRALVTDPDVQHLFIVGAYRDNEVGDGHALALTLDEIRAAGRHYDQIELAPLSVEAVTELIADTFGGSSDRNAELAKIVHQKTRGNPFFVGEFLTALHTDGLVRFDGKEGVWTWDPAAIARAESTSNVVELVAARLRTLPKETMALLQVAACIGNAFDLRTLATVGHTSLARTAGILDAALECGLVLPTDDAYKYMRDMDEVAAILGDRAGVSNAGYRFLHDRVHQAVYSSLSEYERKQHHLEIGRTLLQRASPAELEDQIIGIANHFDMAIDQIGASDERQALAKVFLQAGQRAKASMAYAPAAHYLRGGLGLLGADAWTSQRELALKLHTESAAAAYLTEQFDELEQLVETVVAHSDELLEQVPVLSYRIQARINQRRPREALELALDLLDGLGVKLTRNPNKVHVLLATIGARRAMHGRSADEIASLPKMTDARALAAMDILRFNASSTYFIRPNLFVLFALKMVRLALQYGNSSAAANGFELYGMFLCGAFYDADRGYQLGKLGFRILERYPSANLAGKMSMIWGTFIGHWRDPVIECARDLLSGWRAAVDGGDLEYGAYGVLQAFNMGMQAGWPLADMLRRFEEPNAWLQSSRQVQSIPLMKCWMQAALHLVDEERVCRKLEGELFDTDAQIEEHLGSGDHITVAYAGVAEGMLAYILGDMDRAELALSRAKAHEDQLFASYMIPSMEFYHAMAAVSRPDVKPTGALRRRLARVIRRTRHWARTAACNHEHRLELLLAEQALLAGAGEKARGHYRRAVDLAAANGFLHEEGVACERFARYWAAQGEQGIASIHMTRARHRYLLWGAVAKARELQATCPELLLDEGTDSRSALATATATSTVGEGTRRSRTVGTETQAGLSLDLASVLRASQAIAREVGLADLLRRLITIVIQNAGAQKGFLLLRRDGEWRIEAEGSSDSDAPTVLQSVRLHALEDGADPPLALSIVHYVIRTSEIVVCDDAIADVRFRGDAYVRNRNARSVLCLPITSQRELVGIAYLENDLMPGAFTADRVEVLELLSGQFAGAIEKAELYQELEDKVKARTEELELRNRFIKATFGRYLSDGVVESLLESEGALELGGHKRLVTILMSDLRGFTALSEMLPPEQVVAALNAYMAAMTEIIERHGGMIDEIIGDALLVVFGALATRSDDAARAIACAIEMQRAMSEVNEGIDLGGLPPLEMGIGLNTGQVVIGNIGSERRTKFGVVGRHVNLCGRIEGYTVGGQILASAATVDGAGRDSLTILGDLVVHPKGVREPITIFEIGGIGAPFHLALEPTGEELIELQPPLPAEVWELEDKHVTAGSARGTIVRLSRNEAEIELEGELPEPMTDLRLRLADVEGEAGDVDVYAKVLARKVLREGTRLIRFTSVGAAARAALDARL